MCGGDYDAHVLGSELHGGIEGMHPNVWDDPIFESHLRFTAKDDPARMEKIAKGFRDLSKKLAAHAKQCGAGRQEYVYRVADHVAQRYTLSAMLLAAYRRKDRRTMRAAQAKITPAIASVKALERAFRAMWMSHNKPEGMETIQARLGMLEARYRELDRRIAEYLDGKVDRIAELECNCAV